MSPSENLVRINAKLWVTEELLTTWFECDYGRCKGACCWETFSDEKLSGGVVLPKEREAILKEYSTSMKAEDMFEDHEGYSTTMLDAQDRCVFCGKYGCMLKVVPTLDIPVYCELFPIEPSWNEQCNRTELGVSHLFDKWCNDGRTLGKLRKMSLVRFERRALTRFLGADVYSTLRALSDTFLGLDRGF